MDGNMEEISRMTENMSGLKKELDWLDLILKARSEINQSKDSSDSIYNVQPVLEESDPSYYAEFIRKKQLGIDERLALILALAPHLNPKALDIFLNPSGPGSGFGGLKGKNHHGFLPTGETLLFVLAGNDLDARASLFKLFSSNHLFAKEKILWIDTPEQGEPAFSGALRVSIDFLDRITSGEYRTPGFAENFPAQELTTEMQWDDVVLNRKTKDKLGELKVWLKHKDELLDGWRMRKRLRPGYMALFYGPPGTGKSLTAAMLGNSSEKQVFRIDLSRMVSKYIGETEKNLAKVFERATNKDWILFFDEADALFGKRTETKDAHDKYANQEVSYLLQKVEEYNGLVILATNMKNNIDPAFLRRFKAIIHFPLPDEKERELLWMKGFSPLVTLEEKIDLRDIARQYKMTGSNIINVIEYCSLKSLGRGDYSILKDNLHHGIKEEFMKEGRTI